MFVDSHHAATSYSRFHQTLDDTLNGILVPGTMSKITNAILADEQLQKNSRALTKLVRLLEISEPDERNLLVPGIIACLTRQRSVNVQIKDPPYFEKQKNLNILLYKILQKNDISLENKLLGLQTYAGLINKKKDHFFGLGENDYAAVSVYFGAVFTLENLDEKQPEEKARIRDFQTAGFELLETGLEKALAIPTRYAFKSGYKVESFLETAYKFSNGDFLQEKAAQLLFHYIEDNRFEVDERKSLHTNFIECLNDDHPVEAAWLSEHVVLLTEELKLKESYTKFSFKMLNFSWGENYNDALEAIERNVAEFRQENQKMLEKQLAFSLSPVPKLFAKQTPESLPGLS
jgi:hypothetical protein